MSKSLSLMSIQQYRDSLAKDLTIHVMTVVDQFEAKVGKDKGDDLVTQFLQLLVGTAIFAILSREQRRAAMEGREAGPKEADATMVAYQKLKSEIQDALGSAFRDASYQFSGHHTDFYCQIKPVPPPVNSEPC